jgi:hypothetical protein
MSAAVVPGAKFFPTTTNDSDPVPLMLIPPVVLRTVAWPFAGLRADMRRASSGRRRRAGFEGGGAVFGPAAEEPLLLFLDPRLADEERCERNE